MDVSEALKKFIDTLTIIEGNRAFDRKIDRLKKSSSAVTVWAVIPAIFGIYGIAQFYLNRPLEGLLILCAGLTVSALTIVSSAGLFIGSYLPIFSSY